MLARFSWRNLSIQGKLTLLLLAQALLLALLAGIVIGVQGQVRAQVRTINQQIDASLLAGERITLLADDLRRIEERLADSYNNQTFNPQTSPLFDDYNETLDEILTETDTLDDLVNPEIVQRATLAASINQVVSSVIRTSETFEDLQDNITVLNDPDEGLLVNLADQGEALEGIAFAQGQQTGVPSDVLLGEALLIRSVERSLIETGSQDDLILLRQNADQLLETYQNLPEARRVPGLETSIETYLDRAGAAAELIDTIELQLRALELNRTSISTSAGRIETLIAGQATREAATIDTIEVRGRNIVVLTLLGTIAISGVLIYSFGRALTNSIVPLVVAAQRLEAGDLSARAELTGEDEFSQLGRVFNSVGEQLQGLVESLEQRVAERTRDLTITAEIGRAVTDVRDTRDLLDQVVDLIRERFDFYHTQVFLVDDTGETANLVASTGTAGRELLARRHALAVGSQSVIGRVTANGEPVVASDTSTDPTHRRNELLPNTRSEMALPMRIGERVIGALDVQSVSANAFDEDTVAVFQIMADQLAVAIENARLYSRLEDAHSRIELIQRRMTSEAWRSYQQNRSTRGTFGYELTSDGVVAHGGVSSNILEEAIRTGQLIHQRNGDSEPRLAIPIRVRGEVVGAFQFVGENIADITDEDLGLIEAVMDRVSVALDNLRLVEQTARRAEYEQVVNEITAKIVGSTDINLILQTTVQELGRILRAPNISIQLRREGEQS
ncbi:MAG: GAF domain-containing protein [Chloroflexi bacterium]|nr:GAF domain-containing protein [Chloroflexota bacterium]